MYYWNRDLRPDLGNNVPTSSADPAFWQHMTTFAISIGAAGTLDPSTDLPGLTSGAISWPSPDNNTSRSIDDLWHASINGHGSFVLANDADEFTNALRAALAAITERTGSFANVSTNSTQVNAGAEIFQARFISGKWTGELNSYPITGLTVSSTPSWNASAGIPATGRNIITYNGVTGATFPTSSQIAALVRTDSPSVSGADNAAYIAGDRSLEIGNGGTLRDRNHLLGDIVHSSPAYDRGTDVVYVGANDGMLHAFDADDGSEVFAYVPGGISIPDLATLSDPDYEHRYFVDGPISISRRSQTPAQSVLVGALGRGGKGIYSLDVTHPNTFDDSDVRWERTETPGLNMGQVLGQPIIAKLNNGQVGVIVPNGVNSQNERAVLLVYALNGTLLAEIDTGEGSSAQPNGLMAATTRDIDGNGTVDYVFAGDLSGNLWKFNLSSASTTAWASASNRLLMFTAVNADGERQPITSAPALARDPNTYELWVFFGTGRFMSLDDVSNHEVQSLYGIKDGMTAVTSRSLQLQQRNIIVAGTAANGSAIRGFEPHGYLDESKRGWYIDLLTPPNPPGTPEGERVVSDIQVIASTFIASTIIPDMDPCLPGGTGFINALDAFSGTSLTTSFFDIDGDGFYSDETIDPGTGLPVSVGSIDPSVGMPSLPAILNNLAVVGGSSGGVSDFPVDLNTTTGRVSWREIIGD
ncbi:pilus assembly protein [Pseudoxanthomonas kalamensis DSM 18571]|nr:pilus assembly protein [Pseudoxanthomonas kalamensis DSM 18571]